MGGTAGLPSIELSSMICIVNQHLLLSLLKHSLHLCTAAASDCIVYGTLRFVCLQSNSGDGERHGDIPFLTFSVVDDLAE